MEEDDDYDIEFDGTRCEKCGLEVNHEDELLEYDEMRICTSCFDELRLREERELLERELDDFGVWDD